MMRGRDRFMQDEAARCVNDIREMVSDAYEILTEELFVEEESARNVIREAVEEAFKPKRVVERDMNRVYREFLMDAINILQREVEKYEDRD